MIYFWLFILLIGIFQTNLTLGIRLSNSDKLIENYQKDIKINYNINISVDSSYTIFPRFITVMIKNNGDEVRLNNFVISFYYGNSGFNGLSKDFRFLKTDLILQKKQILKRVIYLDSLDFTDFGSNKSVDFDYVKKQLTSYSTWTIRATMNDKRLFEDRLRSSDLVYSNIIELKNK